MKHPGATHEASSAAERISARIAELDDWRGDTLARIRAIIKEADPGIVEEWKWMGTPVWSRGGIICTGESYTSVVKMTFAKGAFLEDPSRLFNASLEGNLRRAIDVREGEKIDATALKALVRAAIAMNLSGKKAAAKKSGAKKATAGKSSAKTSSPKKAATKMANAKKSTTKMANAKKTATKKSTPKKTATKMENAKKSTPKKTATKKANARR